MDYNKCFGLFNSSYIDKEIKKNVLLNNIKNKEDREIIEKFVENVYLKYCIKADSINKESEENFSEIEIIEININNYRTIYDIYGILLSIIPYPILAIFRYNNRISIAVSNRILSEEKNNKGKIFTSYLIKEENISNRLKVDIDNCKTLKDIYEKWIFNVENVAAYYEKIDSVMQVIEKGLHIKSEEVLENLESYIAKYCGTYNMKPKDGWKSKLEKYSDSPVFIKKVEIHLLWEYLSENAFLKNKLIDFSDWKDFKESCSYNSLSNLYYSQYNRMSDDENISDIDKYMKEHDKFTRYNEKTIFEKQKSETEETKKFNDDNNDNRNVTIEFNEYQKQMLQTIKNNFKALEQADYEIKDDKNFMLQAIKEDSLCIIYASDRLKNDSDFMLQAIEEEGLNIQYSSDKLKNDGKFIAKATEIDNICLLYASDELKSDNNFMLSMNEIYDKSLAFASDELKNNKDFILSAAEKSIWALAYASDRLKNDREFVLQVIEKNSWSLKFASDNLKNDKEIVIKAIEKDSWFLAYARNELRTDIGFLLKAINVNIRCIEFANENLRNKILIDIDKNNSLNNEQKDNEDYMLQLIKKDYFNIRLASDRLKSNSNFILKAMKENHRCLAYASDELRSNKDFILKVFNTIGNYIFALVSEKLKCDKNFILKLLEINYLDFAYVSYELRNDKVFMENTISKNAETIEFASYELRNNREFVLQEIEKDSLCFVYASDELKNNKKFMLDAIKRNYQVIEYSKDIFKDDKDIIIEALKRDMYAISLEYASDHLKNDKDFMLQAIEINYRALKYLSDKLRNDKDFMLKAFEKDNRTLAFASDNLKIDKIFMSEINKINENTMILEYNCVSKWDFIYRNEIYGLVGYLENKGISVLEKDEFSMTIYDRQTSEAIECNRTPLNLINQIFYSPESKTKDYYILNWKLHITGTTKENLKKFDSYMRQIKLAYNISQIKSYKKSTVIEYTSADIEIEEKNKPLRLYMDKYIKSEENDIILEINNIKPHSILYLSNIISMLAINNNIRYRDYISIIDNRDSFIKTWLFLMKNDIKYIFKFQMEIFEISEDILKQIEKFLREFNIKYYIQRIFDNVILTMYPTNKEAILFVCDVLEINNIEFEENRGDTLDEIDSAGNSLWMFETSKEEKEEISKILNEPDQARVKRLKEWGAPENIIKFELAPVDCNYGAIIDYRLQSQIENILQSLKVKYCIMDKNQKIIKNYDNFN